MGTSWDPLYADLRRRTESYGIRFDEAHLGREEPGKFDGLSVTMNPSFDPEQRCYYLAHAVGSIVRWCVDPDGCQSLFRELDAAKKTKKQDAGRLEQAIGGYLHFEEGASEYAVWLLADLGHAGIIPAYTNFFRADAEAMAEFHRSGAAPVWRDFFPRWNHDVAAGTRTVRPYTGKAIPPFRPVRMRKEEIIQEKDGKP